MSSGGASAFDLEDLVHLEQSFFDAGYTDGHAHGRIHGLIEGRALGREKGYELWEEIGFYEGFARLWAAACQSNDMMGHTNKSRTENHVRHLLTLTSQFPRVNPSTAVAQDRDGGTEDTQLDVTALLSKIRARYKALCATVGVRPRLQDAGSSSAGAGGKEDVGDIVSEVQPRKKAPVWRFDANPAPANPAEMSF